MHEAKKSLTDEQIINDYIPILRNICGNGIAVTAATAAQRAEPKAWRTLTEAHIFCLII